MRMRREPLFSAKKRFPDPPQKTPGVSAPVGRRWSRVYFQAGERRFYRMHCADLSKPKATYQTRREARPINAAQCAPKK
jgi:hypothetical protein